MMKNRLWILAMVMIMSQAAGGALWGADNSGQARSPVVDQDLVIQLKDLSGTAQFYPVIIEGVQMEVLAVKAPDGSYRTVFNTCQVCYASGRGFYKQSGTALVCQNCGNRFPLSRVEVSSGGCNPVPIFPQYKVQDDEKIVIPKDFLIKAKGIFARWKV
ncbi:DUF2318 domain-containing protein [Treponema primitia]|uniref:DUF2318 domain-containing protein n=1 Tax=Treponema primitia TaxID=88058 RepID=UPI0039808243